MYNSDYYQESKYCPRCDTYVRFLKSLEACFCVECGAKVRLFSPGDRRAFMQALHDKRKGVVGQQKRVS
jgi:hypothetical protein